MCKLSMFAAIEWKPELSLMPTASNASNYTVHKCLLWIDVLKPTVSKTTIQNIVNEHCNRPGKS